METHMLVRLVVGLPIAVVALAVAGRRVLFLYRMIAAGQPSPGRLDAWPKRLASQVTEVFGQVRLLKWNIPGAAHFLVFWGFLILTFTIIEAFGALFDVDFHIPLIGKNPVFGFLEDLFGVAVLVGLAAFAIIRLRSEPKQHGRDSRFYGSHTGAAWVVLGLIFLVIFTMFGIRAAQLNTGVSPVAGDAERDLLLQPAGADHRAARRDRERAHRGRHGHRPDRRGLRLPGDGHLLQAPAHLPGAAQRADQARPRRPRPWAPCCR